MPELKKARALIMFLVGNQKWCILVSLSNYIMFSCIEWNFLDKEWEQNFDKEPLPLEKNNYATKIVKAYIVYDLDSWLNNPPKNFHIINLLV